MASQIGQRNNSINRRNRQHEEIVFLLHLARRIRLSFQPALGILYLALWQRRENFLHGRQRNAFARPNLANRFCCKPDVSRHFRQRKQAYRPIINPIRAKLQYQIDIEKPNRAKCRGRKQKPSIVFLQRGQKRQANGQNDIALMHHMPEGEDPAQQNCRKQKEIFPLSALPIEEGDQQNHKNDAQNSQRLEGNTKDQRVLRNEIAPEQCAEIESVHGSIIIGARCV